MSVGLYRGPGCPRCWNPLPQAVLDLGDIHCGECDLAFTAVTFHPPERAAVAIAEPSGGATCAVHARNAAAAACQRCGAFMCALCRIDVEGRALCAACFNRGRADESLEAAQSTFRSWRTLGIHLAILGVPLYIFGILIGPASIVASLRGMSQSRKSGDEGGMLGPALAIVFGVLETVAGLFIVLVLAKVWRKHS